MMLEVVEPNENAITYEINNSEKLAEAITKLTTDADMRSRFSQKSRLLFEQRFQIEAVHQSMLSLYTKLIQSNK